MSTRLSPSNLNKGYLTLLNKYPLLTKAITTALLNSLNEQIASFLAGDLQHITIKLGNNKFILPHTLTAKVPLMALYGFALNTPFAHYAYKLLNKLYLPPLSPKKKVAQILTSMATITPIISAITIAYISLINNIEFKKMVTLFNNEDFAGLKFELKELFNRIKVSLKNTLFPVIRSSWVSSPLFMMLAQKFLEPNLWVVFFSFCYFILGTFNNTQIKKAQLMKKLNEEKKQDSSNELSSTSSSELELEVVEGQDADVFDYTGEKLPRYDPESQLGAYSKGDYDHTRTFRQGSSSNHLASIHFDL